MARRAASVVSLLIGAVVGFAVLGALGYLFFQWWETSVPSPIPGGSLALGSIVVFGPLGAAIGALFVQRPDFEPSQQRWVLAAGISSLAAGFVTWMATDATASVLVLAWALAISLLVWLVSSRRA